MREIQLAHALLLQCQTTLEKTQSKKGPGEDLRNLRMFLQKKE
jgi:hypothetical protein